METARRIDIGRPPLRYVAIHRSMHVAAVNRLFTGSGVLFIISSYRRRESS